MKALVIFLVLTLCNTIASAGCLARYDNNTHADYTKNLFYIEKNNNENTAFYDINLLKDGTINPKAPIDYYWLELASDGRRSEVTMIQRKLAFGIHSVKEIVPGKRYAARVATMDKDLYVVLTDSGCVYLETDLNGRKARLERIMLNVSGPTWFSTLHYLDYFGRDFETGEVLTERYVHKEQ